MRHICVEARASPLIARDGWTARLLPKHAHAIQSFENPPHPNPFPLLNCSMLTYSAFSTLRLKAYDLQLTDQPAS